MSSDYFDPEAKTTIKVKIPAYTVEVDIAVWSATYGIVPEFDQTMIQAVREDVQYYFGAVDCIVNSTGAAQQGAVQASA
jgi:short-subunit dehydrogenase